MIELHAGPEDLLRYRFAISPLWETMAALQAVLLPQAHPQHVAWLRKAVPRIEGVDLEPIRWLVPHRGPVYVPDFLTPPPESPLVDVEHELERVRRTPAATVRRELGWAARGRTAPPGLLDAMDHPRRSARRYADLIATCWERLIAPDWPRLRDLLDGDILVRARHIAAGGAEAMLAQLHPQVQWDPPTVRVDMAHTQSRDLDGAGLVFVPSVFSTRVLVMLDPPWQPTLVYPARGVATLWEQRVGGEVARLGPLVGPTRARLLPELGDPVTTTHLAARLGLAVGTVSEHLSVLRTGGLVTSHRVGREVLYELTALGHALLSGTE